MLVLKAVNIFSTSTYGHIVAKQDKRARIGACLALRPLFHWYDNSRIWPRLVLLDWQCINKDITEVEDKWSKVISSFG